MGMAEWAGGSDGSAWSSRFKKRLMADLRVTKIVRRLGGRLVLTRMRRKLKNVFPSLKDSFCTLLL